MGMPTPKQYVARDGTKTWQVRFRVRGTQTSLTFDTRAEADTFARDVENRGAARAYDDVLAEEADVDELTMDQWAERYFSSLTISPGQIDNNRRDWRLKWQPDLGHLRLSQVKREDVTRALLKIKGKPKTVFNAWSTLTSMMKWAVLDGHVDRNPCLGVKLPDHEYDEEVEHRYLLPAELMQVIEDTSPHFRPLVWMLAGTGMRWSEATALNVGDVDLDARTVRVVKAWKRDRENHTYYIGKTKTKKSKRTITLPKEVVEAVRPLVEGRKRGDFLFTNTRGTYVKHDTFYREHWVKRCTKNIEAPRPRIHDLRHSHVAILIAGGVRLEVIQARLGHEDYRTTINGYGHLLPDLQVAAAAAADAVFASAPKQLRPPAVGSPSAVATRAGESGAA